VKFSERKNRSVIDSIIENQHIDKRKCNENLIWFLAFIITLRYIIRKTGPTYLKAVNVNVNDSIYEVKLVRSPGLDERPEIKLKIADTSSARLFYKRFKTTDKYSVSESVIRSVNSFIMNKVFKITEEEVFAEVPQPPAEAAILYRGD
jgi:hypothetical protein